MIVLFNDSGYNHREVDYFYAEEYSAAKKIGISVGLLSFEELVKHKNTAAAIKNIPSFEQEIIGVYRGWMLKEAAYKNLYDGLLSKNIRLINSPSEYAYCHYLPFSYQAIESKTPFSKWMDLSDGYTDNDFLTLAAEFNGKPIVVKDYVKSQKHYWAEACFIPDSNDKKHLLAVTKKFLELQEDDLNIGIVYREFIPFEPLTNHSVSGMPLTKEFRVFVLNKKIIQIFKYWDEGEYDDELPGLDFFQSEIDNITSHFYTMDIAKTIDGKWLIVELGDGQVAGLPDNADKNSFYKSIKYVVI